LASKTGSVNAGKSKAFNKSKAAKDTGGSSSKSSVKKAKAERSVSPRSSGGEGVMGQSASFFRESIDELKKVTTPTKQETVQATIVTIIIMVFVALCLFLLDFLFGNLMESVLG
jgi:preprotein translocase SecE subunit